MTQERDVSYSQTEDSILLKWQFFPKIIYRLNTKLIKIPADVFAEVDKLILKCIQKCTELRMTRTILKMNKAGGLHFPILKVQCCNNHNCGTASGQTQTSMQQLKVQKQTLMFMLHGFLQRFRNNSMGKNSLFNRQSMEK